VLVLSYLVREESSFRAKDRLFSKVLVVENFQKRNSRLQSAKLMFRKRFVIRNSTEYANIVVVLRNRGIP